MNWKFKQISPPEWPRLLAAVLLTTLSPGVAVEPDVRRDATVEAVDRALPAVVNIGTTRLIKVRDPFEEMLQEFWGPIHRRQLPDQVGYSIGSGVIIDEDGYILTNDHVVQRADKIWIQPSTTTNIYEAVVVASDNKTDITLLKIKAKPGEKFTAIKFAHDDDLFLGETVLALGNPFRLGGSVSRGILSSKSRIAPKETEQLDIPNWLQTDASINPGSSGGPLVNLRGELIGLNVAILPNAQGIGFAIPVKRIAEALSEMFTPETTEKRLWFGARVQAGAHPLAITAVQPESPAAKAGLRAGDLLLHINGRTPKNFMDATDLLVGSDKPDATLTVRRNGETLDLPVRLVPEKTFFNAELIQKRLGVSLQEITPQQARSLGLNSTNGLLVAGVEQNTPAAKALQPGILVLSVDGMQPADVTDAAKIIARKKPGENVRLGVVVQQRRGNVFYSQSADVEVPVR